MNDSKPANSGNASHIIETNKPVIKLALLRFEAIFDFYSEEPINIIVKKIEIVKTLDFTRFLGLEDG